MRSACSDPSGFALRFVGVVIHLLQMMRGGGVHASKSASEYGTCVDAHLWLNSRRTPETKRFPRFQWKRFSVYQSVSLTRFHVHSVEVREKR